MQGAFYAADRDRSGYLDAQEIYNALATAGFLCSLPTVQTISAKYATPQGIPLAGFLQIVAHLGNVI